MQGKIIYEGKSELNGEQIVSIITDKSSNTKTGDVLQNWVLLRDVNPIEASKTGFDSAICGNCVHRGIADGEHAKGRSCYVNIVMGGPNSIWKAYKAGKYQYTEDFSFAKNKIVRLGAYGDPLAVPEYIWNKLLKYARGHLGYTHQWKSGKGQKYLMASVDSEREYQEAKALGYRTFRVRSKDSELLKTEIACPAAKETGKRLTCEQCLACDGVGNSGNNKRRDIGIVIHGGLAAQANGERNLLKVL